MLFVNSIKTPIGQLIIRCTEDSLTSLSFYDNDQEQINVVETDLNKEIRDQLDAYFKSKLKVFNIPLKPAGTDFEIKIWETVNNIPFGSIRSYGELADELQLKKGARAIGLANSKNPIPIIIPCHRVIGKDGSLTGYAGGIWRKRWLLEHEGMVRQKELFD